MEPQLDHLKTWLQQRETLQKKDVKSNLQKGAAVLFQGDKNQQFSAAQKLAKEAGKELHRVNLSQVVSKYIGETEKNLAALFTEAAEKNWILFFDEEDALFGKRTDVKDAHDRYANLEISYLLKEIQRYNGMVILSTNRKQNIDSAFLRRLRFVVDF